MKWELRRCDFCAGYVQAPLSDPGHRFDGWDTVESEGERFDRCPTCAFIERDELPARPLP